MMIIEGIIEDITERRVLKQQLLQSQKMEAIGRLAGGISHDFNNLLSVIMGNIELLSDATNLTSAQQHCSEEVMEAARRAAQLTRQLLAFSRKQVPEPKVVDLNPLISDLTKLLRRLIGEDVQMVTELTPSLAAVRVDPAQIEQIVMNLATNARDAMPNGGRLTIRTAETELGAEEISHHPYARPGRYVHLSVSDTGTGINKELQGRLFESLFTTKEEKRGTPLGLAMVYEIVKQSGGYVSASSEPGAGTAFEIYLPVVDQPAASLLPRPAVRPENPQGTETILLLEDDEPLRKVAHEFLAGSGYNVLDAGGGDQAVDIAQQYAGPISLVVSDVILPEISGPEVVAKLQAIHSEMKALYISGYADAPLLRELIERRAVLMQKPLSRSELLKTVNELLHVHEDDAARSCGAA